VTAQALVRPGPLVVSLFGTGGISAEIVPMLAHALPMTELRVTSRRAESMAAFVEAHAATLACPMRAEPDARRATDGAGLVITLTESPSPLILPGMLAQGAVVCSMGSYNEVDFAVLEQCNRFVVDDIDFASEMGDGGAWIRQGHLSREAFAQRVQALACQVLAGEKPGRTADTDRVMALVQGMAIGDVAFAAQALASAEARGLGRTIELD
jgi:ornithine cyclodeaminase/alanine dehydrogenase-like protein (mu-crystallin family)